MNIGDAATPDGVRVLYVGGTESADAVASGLPRADDRFTVATATSSDEGVERLAADAFDCVVAEYDLPDGDGIEFLDTVRERRPELPFVLFPANGSETIASRSISAGVSDYLPQRGDPEGYERLAKHVYRALDGRRARTPPDADRSGVPPDRGRRDDEVERYETVLTALGDPVYAIDADGCYTFVNGAFTSMTGHSEAELLGEHTAFVVGEEAVEKGIELTRDLLRAGEGASRTCEVDVITADGDRISCENNVALLPLDDGEFRGTAGVVRDISERKARKRELEHKNERLEGFASVVSHDLRNPLSVAKTSLELVRDEPAEAHLDRLETALDRIDALISDLLEYARQGEAVRECEPVALSTLADACWQTVTTADAELVVDTTRTIQAERPRLRQLLENLFRNAVEHGSTSPDSQARQDAGEDGGDGVTVTVGDLDDGFYVADDGQGIPADERDQVLNVGYSTSAEGTGLGLSIVSEIADAHGWTTDITTSEDGGARFEFTDATVR